MSLSFSPNGKYLTVSYVDGVIKILIRIGFILGNYPASQTQNNENNKN